MQRGILDEKRHKSVGNSAAWEWLGFQTCETLHEDAIARNISRGKATLWVLQMPDWNYLL